jgi:hypothetical protein
MRARPGIRHWLRPALLIATSAAAGLLVVWLTDRRGTLPPITTLESQERRPVPVVWDFSADFETDPTRARNPSADRRGTDAVWRYAAADGPRARDPAGFRRLTRFRERLQGAAGFHAWIGSDDEAGPIAFPIVGVRGGGDPSDRGFAHPSTRRPAVIAWRSPVSGRVVLSGYVSDQDTSGGDGVAWALRKGRSTLARGRLGNGGAVQRFRRAGVAVKAGDVCYLAIAPRRGSASDSTGVSLRIAAEAANGRPRAQ